MLATSLSTNGVVVLALAIPVLAFFFLGAGNYGAHTTLIHWGGYFAVALRHARFIWRWRSSASPPTAELCFPSGRWPDADNA
jgi:hypothetical protein